MSQQINLCNPLFRKQEKYFSAITMVQSLTLIILGCVLFYSYLAYQTRALAKQAEQMVQMHDNTQRQLTTLATTLAARKPDSALTDAVAKAEQAVHTRLALLDLLQQGKLGNQSGFSDYFEALSRQSVNGLWLTGFDVGGGQITISGRALQAAFVPQLIQRLKLEPRFSGVDFTTLDIHHPETPATTSTDSPSAPLPYIEFTLGNTKAEPPQ